MLECKVYIMVDKEDTWIMNVDAILVYLSFYTWAVVFLVVWGVYTGRTCLRHAYAVGFYQGFGLRGV